VKTPRFRHSLFIILVVIVLLGGVILVDYLVQLGRSEGKVQPGTEAQIGGAFTLLDQTGRRVSERDFADKYKLIFFGFTHCPDVCPTALSKMSQVLRLLGPRSEQLYPLFITVDPERDSPERLHYYSQSFAPGIVYLTGTEAEIKPVLEAWKATRAKIAAASGGAEAYAMTHSSLIYLMTPDNRLAQAYTWEDSPEDMVKSLGRWLTD